MSRFYEWVLIAVLLFAGFLAAFLWVEKQDIIKRLMKSTMEQMDEASRKRLLDERKRLTEDGLSDSIWSVIERNLFYSGLKWKYPFLTVENLIAGSLVMLVLTGGIGMTFAGMPGALATAAATLAAEYLIIRMRRVSVNRAVNENLPKFLDFLGSYSAVGGDLTAIFSQVAKYMDDPLGIVLEECCHEAEFTGDMGIALLYMREKIEHPQFKALINHIEINMRYCADYAILIQSSRRSLRDYMKACAERETMLKGTALNMLILFFMSFISLAAVDKLIDFSVWEILLFTVPGRIALGIFALILILFMRKVYENGR